MTNAKNPIVKDKAIAAKKTRAKKVTIPAVPEVEPRKFEWRTPRLRWFILAVVVIVSATAQNVADAQASAVKASAEAVALKAEPIYVSVPNSGPAVSPSTTTTSTTRPPVTTTSTTVPVAATEDTVKVASPLGPNAAATLSEVTDKGACMRTTFTDGSFVNLRPGNDGAWVTC